MNNKKRILARKKARDCKIQWERHLADPSIEIETNLDGKGLKVRKQNLVIIGEHSVMSLIKGAWQEDLTDERIRWIMEDVYWSHIFVRTQFFSNIYDLLDHEEYDSMTISTIKGLPATSVFPSYDIDSYSRSWNANIVIRQKDESMFLAFEDWQLLNKSGGNVQ